MVCPAGNDMPIKEGVLSNVSCDKIFAAFARDSVQGSLAPCDSHGYGAECQRVLVKEPVSPLQGSGDIVNPGCFAEVRVKNTFIDDWVETNGLSSSIALTPACRSLPPSSEESQLIRCLVERTDNNHARSSSGSQSGTSSTPRGRSPVRRLPLSPGSTSFGDTGSVDAISDSAPSWRSAELPDFHERIITIRHTFVHFSPREDLESTSNSRAHSAPAVEWRHHWLREEESTTKESSTKECSVAEVPSLEVGAEVRIVGLAKLPEFNGCLGTVQGWDAALQRFEVFLHAASNSSSSNRRLVKVKLENLIRCTRPSVPPPPPLEPAPMAADQLVGNTSPTARGSLSGFMTSAGAACVQGPLTWEGGCPWGVGTVPMPR